MNLITLLITLNFSLISCISNNNIINYKNCILTYNLLANADKSCTGPKDTSCGSGFDCTSTDKHSDYRCVKKNDDPQKRQIIGNGTGRGGIGLNLLNVNAFMETN
jgi:hypothetical protein